MSIARRVASAVLYGVAAAVVPVPAAWAQVAQLPDSETTRRLAYLYYEEDLAKRHSG